MKKRLTKKGGSGIYLNANDKEAFEHFVNNSTASFLKTGSFGVTYELTLNPGVQSKYLSLDASTYSQPVTKLLLKTVFIYPLKVELQMNRPDNGIIENKHTANIDNFYEEVNIQTDAYLKTMQYLEPLCPAIVYATTIDWNDPFMSFVTSAYSPQFALQLNSYPGLRLGLIAMEIVPNAEILHDYMDTKRFYESFMPKALHTLIEFVIKTGYHHGDFHAANMIVNPNAKDYFWGRSTKVSIIDFGFAKRLSKEKYGILKYLYDQKKYTDFLNMLCNIPRSDGFDLNSWNGYTVMCLNSPPQLRDVKNYIVNKQWMNNQLESLFVQREEAINHLVNSFTAKKLPLSNSAKNEMYNGVHFEKEFIPAFEHTFPVNTLAKNVKNEIDYFGIYNYVTGMRIQVKACYMYVYVLNNNINDTPFIRYAVMVHAGLHNGIDIKTVFDGVNEAQLKQIKSAIAQTMILEKVRFNDFLDYFSNKDLANVTQDQLLQILNDTLWQEDPERAAIALKKLANIPTVGPMRQMDARERFRALPFGEHEEEPEETNGVTNGSLPRPFQFPFRVPFQKNKLTAGKSKRRNQKTKRKQGKKMSRRKVFTN